MFCFLYTRPLCHILSQLPLQSSKHAMFIIQENTPQCCKETQQQKESEPYYYGESSRKEDEVRKIFLADEFIPCSAYSEQMKCLTQGSTTRHLECRHPPLDVGWCWGLWLAWLMCFAVGVHSSLQPHSGRTHHSGAVRPAKKKKKPNARVTP